MNSAWVYFVCIFFCFAGFARAEYCGRYNEYCIYGCCQDNGYEECCNYGWAIAVGVVAFIICVGVAIFFVIYCTLLHSRPGRVIHAAPSTNTMTMNYVNTHNTVTTRDLPPGPATVAYTQPQYGQYAPPPPVYSA